MKIKDIQKGFFVTLGAAVVEIMNFVGIRHSYSYQQKTKAITQIVYVSNKVGSLGNAANSPMCSG